MEKYWENSENIKEIGDKFERKILKNFRKYGNISHLPSSFTKTEDFLFHFLKVAYPTKVGTGFPAKSYALVSAK